MSFGAALMLRRAVRRTCLRGQRWFSQISSSRIPGAPDHEQDKLLFTPGPLTTSYTVKQAATHDYGSRDQKFIDLVANVRQRVLDLAGVSSGEYTCVPMQGSGSFGVEACVASMVPDNGKLLVVANGAYGDRIHDGAIRNDIDSVHLSLSDREPCSQQAIEEAIGAAAESGKPFTNMTIVHCETTSGVINDISMAAQLCQQHKIRLMVDSMSAFGAYSVDFSEGVDYLVTSANKCIEGIPGFALVLAKKDALEEARAGMQKARTLTLDVYDQWKGLDASGQFRFTPPTHSLLAFNQALNELEQEGGMEGRSKRYLANKAVILDTVCDQLGFKNYLADDHQGMIISSFEYPEDPNWDFETFYSKLNDRGFCIYPGKVAQAPSFRIGHIGRIFPEESAQLAEAIVDVCKAMETAKYYQG